MKCLAQLNRRRSLLLVKIYLRILAIERGGLWQKADHTIETNLDEKTIAFTNGSLVIVRKESQGKRPNLSCASELLPDILQELSSLKRADQIIDAAVQLPVILQALSQDNTSETAEREREILLWRDSLGEQTEILHDREAELTERLEEHKRRVQESKYEMKIYSDRIRRDQTALDVQLAQFKTDRAVLSQTMQQIREKQVKEGI